MNIFAPKCKNRDLNGIGAISFIKYVHMVEGVAVKSSSNRVNPIEKHREMGILTGFDGLIRFLLMSTCLCAQ